MNITQLLKQAQQLQKKVSKKQAELDAEVHEFGNDLVHGKIKGSLEIISLEINPSLCNEESKEDLEALVMVSLNKVIKEVTEKKDKAMDAITGSAKGFF